MLNNLELVRAEVAASVQKSFFELQRTRQILDLRRQMASSLQLASYQPEDLEARRKWAKAEAEMFQAEFDYRLAYSELKRVMGGSDSPETLSIPSSYRRN